MLDSICSGMVEYYRDKFDKLGISSEFKHGCMPGDTVCISVVRSEGTCVGHVPDFLVSKSIYYSVPVTTFRRSFDPDFTDNLEELAERSLISDAHNVPVVLSDEVQDATVYLDVSNPNSGSWNSSISVQCSMAVLAPSKCFDPAQSKLCSRCPTKLKCILQPSCTLKCLLR